LSESFYHRASGYRIKSPVRAGYRSGANRLPQALAWHYGRYGDQLDWLVDWELWTGISGSQRRDYRTSPPYWTPNRTSEGSL